MVNLEPKTIPDEPGLYLKVTRYHSGEVRRDGVYVRKLCYHRRIYRNVVYYGPYPLPLREANADGNPTG